MSAAIYVDIDDVLCETTRELARLVDEHFGRRVPFDSLSTFDLGQSFGLDAHQHGRLLELAHLPDVVEGYSPIAGARAALTDWTRRGYAIVLCTGRPRETRPSTQSWLERHQIPHAELHFIDKYGRHGGPGLSALDTGRLCLAVEDSYSTARFLRDAGVSVALMDRPWNRAEPATDGIARCRGWNEITTRWPDPRSG